MKKIILLFVLSVSLFANQMYARGAKIKFGTTEVIKRVADLPNTDDYLADDGSGNNLDIKLYMNLAIKYKRFEIAGISYWIVEEPIFVGIDEFHKEDGYYDLSNDEVNAIIKKNNLNRDEMLHLGFWSRHGGILVCILLIGGYLLYLKLSPDEKEDEIEYEDNNEKGEQENKN